MIKQKKSKLEMILRLGFLAMCMWFKNGLKAQKLLILYLSASNRWFRACGAYLRKFSY